MESAQTIGEYLIDQLYSHGVRDMFGVPGDYVLGFFDQVEKSSIRLINTCDEQGAGFAADAYARIRGIGAVCVTYCVGGLKIANTTAQAFAEKSPVIVISGAPGVSERVRNPLLHHKIRDFDTQKKIFEEITVAAAVLDNPQTALRAIDRVIHLVEKHKLPGYIEIPRDIVNVPGDTCHEHIDPPEICDPEALAEAVQEAVAMIESAKQPVIIAGEELNRLRLEEQLVSLAGKLNLPVATTMMGKAIIPESLPFVIGVYEAALGHEDVRSYVESSDCIIMLGALLTDFNLGMFTAILPPSRTICANKNRLTVKHHVYENVRLEDFLSELTKSSIKKRLPEGLPERSKPQPYKAAEGKKLSMKRLFEKINTILGEETIVIADIGEAFFGSLDLLIEHRNPLIASAYYTSLGFAVPGSLGLMIADPRLRPLVLVGDGAFQMTGMELSSIARYGLNPVVVVLNNRGYGTERPMVDGPFNDLHPWNYSRIPEVLGAGRGFVVDTERELDSAFEEAMEYREGFSIIDVHLDPADRTPLMAGLTEKLARKIKKVPAEIA